MRAWFAVMILAMISWLAHAGETNTYDECLTEAIRKSALSPHTSTSRCEIVMVEGMRISFTNSHGAMTITAGEGFMRSYTWAGDTRSLVMWPRKKRWYGSLGLYNPGAYIQGELEQWKEHDGIKRCVAEEAQRHFTNTADAVAWIHKRGKPLDYIYNDTGLVVGMDKRRPPPDMQKEGAPGTLRVDVWQIYINGKKPHKLEGSNNKAIIVCCPPTYDLETVTPPAQPVDNDSNR